MYLNVHMHIAQRFIVVMYFQTQRYPRWTRIDSRNKLILNRTKCGYNVYLTDVSLECASNKLLLPAKITFLRMGEVILMIIPGVSKRSDTETDFT